MAAHVMAAGIAAPDKDALLVIGPEHVDRWTFATLRSAILATATGLQRAGLRPGNKVLMRLGNTVDFPLAYLGALAVGAVPIPTSSALTARETQAILEDMQPALVLHDPAVPCPPVPNVITLDALRGFRTLPAAEIEMGDSDRLGYIIYTSGTSGRPRAVGHAHRAIWARQMMFDGWYGLRDDDRVLHAGAFNWTYTLGTGLMDPWSRGATALIPDPGTRLEQLPELMRAHDATIFAAAPGVYRQLLDRCSNLQMETLRHGLSAGEKLPRTTADRWSAATGRPVYEAYGMSECSTFISHAPEQPVKTGALGRPQPGRRVALLKDGQPVPLGEEGTIAVHQSDPGLMLGYIGAPEETQARMSGAWFLTGDQAVMDANGYVTYLGRNDDMMNAGGFRVSPIEVEAVLANMPGVGAVAVTDVAIKQDARVIAAFYTAPAPLDETAWQAYVTDKLARYKQPRLYIHTPDLPHGANGKVLRRRLRDRFERDND
jgi:acyl-coenzyme A synthetase/AMP-(fatty) acid ligase